jgi:phage anti-repressor protein
MNVITKRRIFDYAKQHPNAAANLTAWTALAYQQQDDAAIVKLLGTTNLDTQLPEQPILARLLHPYVEHRFTYHQWINEAKRRCTNPLPRSAGYRGLATANGEYAMSLTLAACLALRDPTLAGAIPTIAIEEHYRATDATPKVCVNETLRRFIGVVIEGNRSDARRLHEYLEVEEEYDRWIAGKIKSFKMKYRHNDDRIRYGNAAKEIVLSLRMAQEVAQHEKTRRGVQMKIYLEHQKRWKTTPALMRHAGLI